MGQDAVRRQHAPGEDVELRRFAHEVANRLDGALRSVSLLVRHTEKPADVSSLKRAEAALLDLAALTRAALRSRDSASIPYRDSTRSLDEALELALDTVLPACAERSIMIESDIGEGISELRACGLESVALNGLWNAIDALDVSGTVALRATLRDGALVIEISDDGPGVPPDVLPRAFEVGVSGAKRTGIGLSHARAIVEQLGGVIELANNTDGPGATLTVRVPVASIGGGADT